MHNSSELGHRTDNVKKKQLNPLIFLDLSYRCRDPASPVYPLFMTGYGPKNLKWTVLGAPEELGGPPQHAT